MTFQSMRERFMGMFERVVVGGLLIILGIAVLLGLITLYVLLARNTATRVGEITDASMLLAAMQMVFGGVLAVLLGLELMETIRRYDAEHHVRVEVVFFVGLIALGRHVIQMDLAHASLGELVGTSALIIALSAGYFMVRRATRE